MLVTSTIYSLGCTEECFWCLRAYVSIETLMLRIIQRSMFSQRVQRNPWAEKWFCTFNKMFQHPNKSGHSFDVADPETWVLKFTVWSKELFGYSMTYSIFTWLSKWLKTESMNSRIHFPWLIRVQSDGSKVAQTSSKCLLLIDLAV